VEFRLPVGRLPIEAMPMVPERNFGGSSFGNRQSKLGNYEFTIMPSARRYDARAAGGVLVRMGDLDNGDAVLLVEAFEELHDFRGPDRSGGCGGFVGQDERGFRH